MMTSNSPSDKPDTNYGWKMKTKLGWVLATVNIIAKYKCSCHTISVM